MFNKIRISINVPERLIMPALQLTASQIQGDTVLDVPQPRELVDKRLRASAVVPTELIKAGTKYKPITLQPTIEEVSKALDIVRKIDSDAQYRAEIEKVLTEPGSVTNPEPGSVTNPELNKE